MYHVKLDGVRENVARAEAVKKLSILFRATSEQVEIMLEIPAYVLKNELTEDVALQYKAAIDAAGGICQVELESDQQHTSKFSANNYSESTKDSESALKHSTQKVQGGKSTNTSLVAKIIKVFGVAILIIVVVYLADIVKDKLHSEDIISSPNLKRANVVAEVEKEKEKEKEKTTTVQFDARKLVGGWKCGHDSEIAYFSDNTFVLHPPGDENTYLLIAGNYHLDGQLFSTTSRMDRFLKSPHPILLKGWQLSVRNDDSPPVVFEYKLLELSDRKIESQIIRAIKWDGKVIVARPDARIRVCEKSDEVYNQFEVFRYQIPSQLLPKYEITEVPSVPVSANKLPETVSNNEVTPEFEGPSFDCKKAKSVGEKLICNDPELSKIDKELAEIYREEKSKSQDSKAFKKQTENAWKWRESNCFDKVCLLKWYAERKETLLGFGVAQ
jgi:hypothetical protein